SQNYLQKGRISLCIHFWIFMSFATPSNCYHETMDHLVDSIYQFIQSIDKNPEAIPSRIQHANISIF
ncbi:hypothetical protein ACUOAQ_21235, partial [Escherichia sp. SP-MK]